MAQVTKVEDKEELASLASTSASEVKSLDGNISSAKSTLSSVDNYDGINVSGAASTLSSNLGTVLEDLDTVIQNITNYSDGLAELDTEVSEEDYLSLFNTDGSREGNAQAIWNFLKAKGLSDAAAAGVLGNIQAECNFSTTAVGDGGTSYGLIQWHNSRWTNLKNFCSQNNLDPSSLRGQLEFLWNESLDPNSSYGKNLASSGFYNASNATDAAVIFHDVVEKSASSRNTVISVRGGYANEWYSKLQGTSLGIDISDSGLKFVNSAQSVVATSTQTTPAPSSTSYSNLTYSYPSSSSSYSSSPSATTTSVSNIPVSTNVNVSLKPADLTEEEYKALFQTDGTTEGNAKVVWNFLKAKGLSDEAIGGVMGNIQAECNFRITAVGDNGTSFGLIQWHAGRWTNLKNYCTQNNLDPNSLQGQLEFLWHESLDPNSSYGQKLASNGFYNASNASDAAVVFHNVVEKSASTQDVVRSKRGGFASTWYDKYKGTSFKSTSAVSV